MVNPFHDVNWNPDLAARRSFGKSLAIGFPTIGLVMVIADLLGIHDFGSLPLWLAVGGLIAGVIFMAAPQIARPFYLGWFFIACCFGIVISNFLLVAFYLLVITPIGLLMRALGRDPMQRRFDRSASTYWKDAEKVVDPTRYFRQF